MGYFANGFVFALEPDFTAAATAAAGRSACGYKHKASPVWLLDLWKPKGTSRHRKAPFCDPAADGFRSDLSGVDEPTRAFLATFERLKRAAGYQSAAPEDANVHLALAVSAAARCPAFFFAANDDETDMGCRTVAGSLVSFGCRLDLLSVQYTAGQLSATPLNFVEDGDDQRLQELITNASGVTGLAVLPPRDIEGGQTLYENPVGQWPKEAGDPAEVLGLGTWDPLLNLETDFDVVFEQDAQ